MFYSFWLRFLTPLARLIYRVRYVGKENIPREGKLIVCSNHKSVVDPFLLAMPFKRQIRFMAKSELFENKFVGSLITALGAFSVDRGVGDSNALDRCGEILEQDGAVGIFIEGTRSLDGKLGKPKSGAVMLAHQHQAPILPVCMTTKTGVAAKPFHKTIISYR